MTDDVNRDGYQLDPDADVITSGPDQEPAPDRLRQAMSLERANRWLPLAAVVLLAITAATSTATWLQARSSDGMLRDLQCTSMAFSMDSEFNEFEKREMEILDCDPDELERLRDDIQSDPDFFG